MSLKSFKKFFCNLCSKFMCLDCFKYFVMAKQSWASFATLRRKTKKRQTRGGNLRINFLLFCTFLKVQKQTETVANILRQILEVCNPCNRYSGFIHIKTF